MDAKEFRVRGKEMVDYIADYLENIRERKVFPNKKPGFLKKQIPDSAPVEAQSWIEIFEDVETIIMPGVTHWQSPHMHAYFPALNSYPSLLGEMLSDAIGSLGFTWASSPACTELEMVVMNWLAKMIGLPDHFLHKTTGQTGGGVIQTTASEATLVCLLAGRTRASKYYKSLYPEETNITNRLVAYCSDQAHSSVEKAALIGLVNIRFVESDDQLSMRGERLQEAITNDRKAGLLPFYVCATLGTTGACAFDNLEEIGKVCQKEKLWLHIDAAYAGSAFICPEFRTWLKGIEYADSLAFNPSKWLMVNFECTAMWVKDSIALHETFNVDPLYLQHEYSGLAIDFMHWQIPLSKKFRALKLWFVIRNYGVSGLQKHIRHSVNMAQKLEAFISSDPRFEIPAKRHLGMVVFRLVGENHITEQLWKRLNSRRNIHLVPASFKGKYVIRFTVTSPRTTLEDIVRDWNEIKTVATGILGDLDETRRPRVPLGDTKTKNENFGTSLLLANSPMSPKIVNGSFAAIYDHVDVLEQYSKTIKLRQNAKDSPGKNWFFDYGALKELLDVFQRKCASLPSWNAAMRRRIRGILMSGKQFSLDSHLDLFHGLETPSNLHSMVDSTPFMEDEENASGQSDSSGGKVSPNGGLDFLEVPVQKRVRSKSVDHQFNSSVESLVANKSKTCAKCGHDLK